MKVFVALMVMLLSSYILLASDMKAITTNGKQVILHSNGNWEYKKLTKSNNSFDFHKAKWGMTKSEIKKTETGKIVRDDNILSRSTSLVPPLSFHLS